MKTALILLGAAALTFLLAWALSQDYGSHETVSPQGSQSNSPLGDRAQTAQSEGVIGREAVGGPGSVSNALEALVHDLLFVPGAEVAAAQSIRRGCAVELFSSLQALGLIIDALRADLTLTAPQLTNSKHVLSILLLGNPANLQDNAALQHYIRTNTAHQNHRIIQGIIIDLISEGSAEEWARLLEEWSELTAKEFRRRLQELFETAPRTASQLAGLLLEVGLLDRAKDHVSAMMEVILEVGDPDLLTPGVLAAFGAVQAKAGGGRFHNFALLWAQKLSRKISTLNPEQRDQWVSAVRGHVDGPTSDLGVDMFLALFAANVNDAESLPTMEAILARASDDVLTDMVLVNSGRVADAGQVLRVAMSRGIHPAKAPASEHDIRMQSSLASALVNTLVFRPQGAATVGPQLALMVSNWKQDSRYHAHLIHLMKRLAEHKRLTELVPELEVISSSSDASLAQTAKEVLGEWNKG